MKNDEKRTPEDLRRNLREDLEYVQGYLSVAESMQMGRHDAIYRLQRVARIADAAIRRALAAEGLVADMRTEGP